MSDRDFSRFSPEEAQAYLFPHALGQYLGDQLTASAKTLPWVKSVPGYMAVGGGDGAIDVAVLCKKNGALQPDFIIGVNGSVPATTGKVFVYDDILLGGQDNSQQWHGLNLRQGSVARNINNAAALAGVRPVSPYQSAGYGWISMPNLNPAWYYEGQQYEDSRFLVGVSAENTTSPAVTAPAGAPTCTPSTSGGYLASGNYDVAYAWVTRINTRKCGHGITTPSPTQASVNIASGTVGSIAVTIPAPPANAIGYVVYCVEAGGTLRAVGAGTALAAGLTHTIKETMAGLAMNTRLYYLGSSQLAHGVIVNLEAASPVTWGTAASFTSGNTDPLWSPFFKDPTQLYLVPASNFTTTLKADKWNISAASMALNQTVTADGEPAIIFNSNNPSTANWLKYRSIPEMMAYAVGGYGTESSGNLSRAMWVQIRSCLTNEILWQSSWEDLHAYSSQLHNYNVGWFDFEADPSATGATKSVDILVGSRRHRAILRQPVICWS